MVENTQQAAHDPMQEVYELSQKYGIPLDPEWHIEAQQAAQLAAQAAEQQYALSEAGKGKVALLVEQFNRVYPKFLKTLAGVGEVLITATQTVLIAFGVPILLLLLLIVEQQRVVHGMVFFETDPILAGFGASVLVAANLILELLIHYREQSSSWVEPARHEFSLRLWWSRILYIVGKSTHWEPRSKSPAQKERYALRIVTTGILVLALAGSMNSIIEKASGNWAQAIRDIATQSTLMQAFTWLGGLLFAFAAVTTAQVLATYTAQKVAEIMLIMQSNTDDKAQKVANVAGFALAAHFITRLKEAQRLRRMSAATAMENANRENIIPVPLVPSVPAQKGTGKVQDAVVLKPQMKKAVTWIVAHREHGLTVRAAASEAGVSPTTYQRAMQYLESLQ